MVVEARLGDLCFDEVVIEYGAMIAVSCFAMTMLALPQLLKLRRLQWTKEKTDLYCFSSSIT